jgi:hypothetical protein
MDKESENRNDCFGELVGEYISGPLIARMYTLGKANMDALTSLVVDAQAQIVKNIAGDSEDTVQDTKSCLSVIAVAMFAAWYMGDLHICDEIDKAVDRAAGLIEVTAEDITEAAK